MDHNAPFIDASDQLGHYQYMKLCNKKTTDEGNGVQGNGGCSISISSKSTAIHWKVTTNWTSFLDKEPTTAVEEAREQAGGRFITPTFEIGHGPL
mmetsp:Transcript_29242/g.41852  ORF Transcript_29242/g.41852 Transcript_29242/m.41852 type:complete len:95 (+) Transcript_29242:1638-1922(+)